MPIAPFVPLAIMGASAIGNAIRGGVQANRAKGFERDFEAADKALQPVSPEQYAYLNRVKQMERSMRMGTDPTTAMARRGLQQGLAQTQTNIGRVGGGASTISGLLRAQQGFNTGMGNVAAGAAQNADNMMRFQGGLIDNIQSRIYDLQMKRRNYAQGKAAYARQAATDSATAAIGSLAQAATMIPAANKMYDFGNTGSAKSVNPSAPGAQVTGIGNPGSAYHWGSVRNSSSITTPPGVQPPQYTMSQASEPFYAPAPISM